MQRGFRRLLPFAIGSGVLTSAFIMGNRAAGPRRRLVSMGVTVADVLRAPKWPAEWPFSAEDFRRGDEMPDNVFYSQPRIVYHIDEDAVGAVTQHYRDTIRPGADVLDICSSWVSHYPSDVEYGRVSGLGMNEDELKKNKRLSDFVVQDLNENPKMPYEDESFDYVTCVVSVDYLTRPLEVFREINRVLRPGGKAIMSISNRCFPTKAIQIWLQTGDLEHV